MRKIIAFFLMLIIICAPIGVSANGNMTISIDTAKILNANDAAFVDINISENIGISAMTISITYDSSALEYVDFKEGIFSDYSLKDFREENYIRLVILENEDIKEDGLLLTLKFKLKDAEKGKLYPISIEHNEGDFCNSKGETVSPKIVSGGVAYIQTDTAEQTPSKYESSSASSQDTSINESSSQSDEASIPSSSEISSSSQTQEEQHKTEAHTQSEVTSSTVSQGKTENAPKWITIPIVLIFVLLIAYLVTKNRK